MNAAPNRLDARFAALKAAQKKAFISFLTAGYPDLETFSKILEGLPAAGVDVIEIGVPFSDPMADGPAIQTANIQAFKAGITVPKILQEARHFRKKDEATPIVLMGYYNPIYSYGVMHFLNDAKKAGVDGFIIPDLPPEEDAEFREPAAKLGLRLIRLVTPTTDEARLPALLNNAGGFLYYVSVTGITGSKSAHAGDLHEGLARIKAKTELPVCIGFGVYSPEQARELSQAADGVIVGSAIINQIAQHIDENGVPGPKTVSDALAFVTSIAQAVHA